MADRSPRSSPPPQGSVESPSLNVFDDEFAFDNAAETTADTDIAQDGMQPRKSISQDPPQTSRSPAPNRLSIVAPPVNRTPSPLRQTTDSDMPSDQKRRTAGTISSTRKGRIGEIQSNVASTYYEPGLHRSSSSASSFVTTTSGGLSNPFADSSGPSHPYTMYPQNTTAGRASSVLSGSTLRAPPRAFTNSPQQQHSRPTHPYALYPQTVFDPAADSSQPSDQIAIGFPGHNPSGERRIGYDGEELDIVGADGHAEQLPPYSRYPDGVQRRDSTVTTEVPTNPPTDLPSTANSSGPDIREQRLSHSLPSPATDSSSSPTLPMPAVRSTEEYGEKSRRERWRERRKAKVCFGKCPMWACALCLVLLVIFAAVLGIVVGRNLSDDDHEDRFESSSSNIRTTVVDASRIANPTGVPEAPLGSFHVPLRSPEESQHGCLVNQQQFAAWSCSINSQPALVKITDNAVIGGQTFQMGSYFENDDEWWYGQVPPTVAPKRLVAVSDLDDPKRGPAYWFQAQYDKIVVLHEADLHVTDDSAKKMARRDNASVSGSQGGLDRVAPGDRPWFCYWNDTWIEGFIYSQPVGASATATSSSVASATLPATGSTTVPTAIASTTVAAETYVTDVVPDAPQASVTARALAVEDVTFQSVDSGVFPRVIKIEERILPLMSNVSPFCQKMQLLDSNEMVPIESEEWGPPLITLEEVEPNSYRRRSAEDARPGMARHRLQRRAEPDDSCHCQWLLS